DYEAHPVPIRQRDN
nr:juvenile hormone binding protein, JHBP=5.3kda Lys-C peptide [Manduca sexta, Peptide Partial, 14 aa] [Manduca sexta]